MPNLHPGQPQGVSTNIYEGMVTRNLVDRTYSVDEIGSSWATYTGARTVPGPIGKGGSITSIPPPRRGQLDRSVPGGPTWIYPKLAKDPQDPFYGALQRG